MKAIQKLILAAGIGTLLILLWKLDAAAVASLVSSVGWGFAFIIAQEAVAHVFNALAWFYAMPPTSASRATFSELYRLRVAGDGINYLTPTAQIGGELARASALNPAIPFEERLAGVVAAKFSQGAAQFFFAVLGAAWLVQGKVPWLSPYEPILRWGSLCAATVLISVIAAETLRSKEPEQSPPAEGFENAPASLKNRLISVSVNIKRFLLRHPGRASASVLLFLLGFAWGGVEIYWGCSFLGLSIDWRTALAIEALSLMIEGVFFMVPAKVGTQEAGKTAVFALLGLPPSIGFAFGVVRHIRELVWAVGGLALYYARPNQTLEAAPSAL